MSGHTPGGRFVAVRVDGLRTVSSEKKGSDGRPEFRAVMERGTPNDALLIAAAPELLEACKALDAWSKDATCGFKEFAEIGARMHAAIAKAEGKE